MEGGDPPCRHACTVVAPVIVRSECLDPINVRDMVVLTGLRGSMPDEKGSLEQDS